MHDRDCRDARSTGRALSIDDLVRLEQFTSVEQVAAFYSQSLSLVRMLNELGEPQKLIEFALKAQKIGYDQAINDCYKIASMKELARRWSVAASTLTANSFGKIVNVRFQP